VSEQNELESRRVWKEVADGIRCGDFEKASAAKYKLEVRSCVFLATLVLSSGS
jgi:hypothetical protein